MEGDSKKATRASHRALSSALLIATLALVVSACASSKGSAPKTATATTEADAGEGAEGPADEEGEVETEDVATAPDPNAAAKSGPCPDEMVLVEGVAADGSAKRFCIDTYEASLVEVMPDGSEKPYPHFAVVDGHDVRAVSRPGVFPQGFISEVQADDACKASSKRLCRYDEWKIACMGPAKSTFPYGDTRKPGTCHDTGKSAVGAVFGAKALASSPPPPSAAPQRAPTSPAPVSAGARTSSTSSKSGPATKSGTAASSAGGKRAHATKGRAASTTKTRPAGRGTPAKSASNAATTKKPTAAAQRRTGKKSTKPASVDLSVWTKLNDPALGQVEGALAKTGDHGDCVNGFGAFDMVGNLHEWVATDPAAPHGTFAGGYYLDTALNGDGCNYRTTAHAHEYHDYSTGFRCCL